MLETDWRSTAFVRPAEIAAAPLPDNDIARAEAYLRCFYDLVKRVNHESFDVEEAARLAVKWWVVHRQLFFKDDKQPLVEGLEDLYAATFRLPQERLHEAAFRRAEAMRYTDRWVNESTASGSPLLAQVEEEWVKSYDIESCGGGRAWHGARRQQRDLIRVGAPHTAIRCSRTLRLGIAGLAGAAPRPPTTTCRSVVDRRARARFLGRGGLPGLPVDHSGTTI